MRRSRAHIRGLAAAAGILLGGLALAWAQEAPETIGQVTAVQRAVSIARAGSPAARPAAARQFLHPADTLETGEQAKVQALFHDDTVLTLGPRTRLDIAEYLHDSGQQVRRMTVTLAQGTVRALVGRAFPGLGSTFVIRAGTASIVANAAYCVVWRTGQETGVANIGSSGPVSFVAEGRVVILEPGFYSIAPAGRPPGAAAPAGDKAPPAVRQAVDGTEPDEQSETPAGKLAEQEIESELRACPPDSPPGGICPRKPPAPALSPATPPAVTSGAKRR
jgi:hypothetical protein